MTTTTTTKPTKPPLLIRPPLSLQLPHPRKPHPPLRLKGQRPINVLHELEAPPGRPAERGHAELVEEHEDLGQEVVGAGVEGADGDLWR
jgi:hypothetical protein